METWNNKQTWIELIMLKGNKQEKKKWTVTHWACGAGWVGAGGRATAVVEGCSHITN